MVCKSPRHAAGKYGVIRLTKSHAAVIAPSFRVNSFGPEFMEIESTLSWGDRMNRQCERVHTQTTMKLVSIPGEPVVDAFWLAADDASNLAGSFMMCDSGFQLDRRLV